MKMLWTFLPLSFLSVYVSVAKDVASSSGLGSHTSLLTLDLANPAEKDFGISVNKSDHVVIKTFAAAGGKGIGNVVFDDEDVWRAEAGAGASAVNFYTRYGKAMLVEVVTGSKRLPKLFFFEHQGFNWIEVSEEVFCGARKDLYNTAMTPRTIDISSLDIAYPVAREERQGSLLYREYTPLEGEYFSDLYDGKTHVWDIRSYPRKLLNLYVYSFNGEAALLHLYFKEGSTEVASNDRRFKYDYLAKIDGAWEPVSSMEFSRKYNLMRDGAKKTVQGDLTVDVLEVGNAAVEVTLSPSEKQPFLTFAPLSETKITKVVEGNTTIWAGNTTSCVSASLLFKEEKPILAKLGIEAGEEEKELYLEKRTFGWYPIAKEAFDAKVEVAGFATLSIVTVALMFAFGMEF
ncbi:uncharacterized protein BEWA_046160 [Theileria equi strain WA]|uniref:Membrane protein, putative n=1 Tax=Theileria equi strain WA TaxID=1537102 RepID=L1L9P9_THEEQ|nr:uncharacterized protein BEWA_046160 [Theileria equi strain WA]EKX72152.1 membrane protein, putative [Theileria equi strain WA]|eukprot:XP_004831604.1 uncharacterized protein BEWA_046160 [Theileria equi strain WA]